MTTVAQVAGILSVLNTVKFSPASMIYLALGSNMGTYDKVCDYLRANELAKITSETITITEKGRILAEKVDSLCP